MAVSLKPQRAHNSFGEGGAKQSSSEKAEQPGSFTLGSGGRPCHPRLVVEGDQDKFTDTVLCVPRGSSLVALSNSSVKVERAEAQRDKAKRLWRTPRKYGTGLESEPKSWACREGHSSLGHGAADAVPSRALPPSPTQHLLPILLVSEAEVTAGPLPKCSRFNSKGNVLAPLRPRLHLPGLGQEFAFASCLQQPAIHFSAPSSTALSSQRKAAKGLGNFCKTLKPGCKPEGKGP